MKQNATLVNPNPCNGCAERIDMLYTLQDKEKLHFPFHPRYTVSAEIMQILSHHTRHRPRTTIILVS